MRKVSEDVGDSVGSADAALKAQFVGHKILAASPGQHTGAILYLNQQFLAKHSITKILKPPSSPCKYLLFTRLVMT